MAVKFNQCNTDVTNVTVHYNMPTPQIKCYNVTVLQPIHGLKTRKYLNSYKLFCCTLKVYWSLH